MKILFFYNEDWEKDYFEKQIGEGFEVEFVKGVVQEHIDLKDDKVDILSVFVGSEIDGQVMDRFPNLKFIATRSTGFDHINIEEAKKRNIVISNVPTYGSHTVAEFAFALLLSLSRKIFPAYEQILKKGSFSKEGLRGFDLAGKTIGVLGVGKIGRNIIKMAKGFDMKVIAFDVNKDDNLAKKIGFEYVDFDKLLSSSDIISLHLPYNPHTHHIINEENIAKIKKGAIIINTSRGGVIETSALTKALQEGILSGAGLDVLEAEIYMGNQIGLLDDKSISDNKIDDMETILHNQYLIDNPNVIITPHNAFNTKEAIIRIFDTTIENIRAFEKGKVINEIN